MCAGLRYMSLRPQGLTLEPEMLVTTQTGVAVRNGVLIIGLWAELVSRNNNLTSVLYTKSCWCMRSLLHLWEEAGEAAVSHCADKPLRTFLRPHSYAG